MPTSTAEPEAPPPPAEVMYVRGNTLYDVCHEPVVLRGVNKMVIWTDPTGEKSFAEIAKTGANSVRIVWDTSGSAADLDAVITRAISEGLLPMVELHGATGNLDRLPAMVDYWVRSDVTSVLAKHERRLLVNIANEAGNGTVTDDAFTASYTTAVQRMRDAGIRTPLVIDATSWGQNIAILERTGPGLIEADPDHNLIFSTHIYWSDDAETVRARLEKTAATGLPLIIGEFAANGLGCASSIQYKTVLAVAEELSLGWYAWEWGPGNTDCRLMDMTPDNTFAKLSGWALEVAVSDPNSIKNTAQPIPSLFTDSCDLDLL